MSEFRHESPMQYFSGDMVAAMIPVCQRLDAILAELHALRVELRPPILVSLTADDINKLSDVG